MTVMKKLIMLFLTVTMIFTISIGCENSANRPGVDDAANEQSFLEEVAEKLGIANYRIPSPVPPVSATPSFFPFPMPEATGELVEKNTKAEIDFSNSANGYVMIRFLEPTDLQLRVRITGPSGIMYTYILNREGDFEVFPLSDGNGTYEINVFEQVEGSRYALALSKTIDVTLLDEFAPFLRPNQYVNFTPDCNIVAKAAELVGGFDDFFDKVHAIYYFVINNFTYDYEFAQAVQEGGHSGYLPDLDAVLASRKGICFDYAAVMTGMLRSQGLPTKLVVGYAGEVYHAWLNVYSEETGWIAGIISFDGHQWNLMDPTFAATGNQSPRAMAFIGDGTNYNAMFLY